MAKREQIEPNPGDVRYIRRDENGRFTTDQVDKGRSLAADNNQRAKGKNPGGQGDRGDGRR
ncbi:hypothetical protein EON82_13555 [bacterium]|nr:MAG: hypothetical protein EON82_13555 [bacterium]